MRLNYFFATLLFVVVSSLSAKPVSLSATAKSAPVVDQACCTTSEIDTPAPAPDTLEKDTSFIHNGRNVTIHHCALSKNIKKVTINENQVLITHDPIAKLWLCTHLVYFSANSLQQMIAYLIDNNVPLGGAHHRMLLCDEMPVIKH